MNAATPAPPTHPAGPVTRAWTSLLLFPVAFAGAFLVGEGLVALMGYPVGAAEGPPWWIGALATLPAFPLIGALWACLGLALVQRSCDMMERDRRRDPQNREYQRGHAVCQSMLAGALLTLGRTDEARARCAPSTMAPASARWMAARCDPAASNLRPVTGVNGTAHSSFG